MSQTLEHLLRHCSWWRAQQRELCRWWERRWAGKQAHAGTCRSLSFIPQESATKRWWTSWHPPRSDSSHPNEEGAVRSGLRAWGSGSALAGMVLYHSFFHSLFLSFLGRLSLPFHLSAGTKGSGGGAPQSSWLAQRCRGYQCPVILYLESIQYD